MSIATRKEKRDRVTKAKLKAKQSPAQLKAITATPRPKPISHSKPAEPGMRLGASKNSPIVLSSDDEIAIADDEVLGDIPDGLEYSLLLRVASRA